MTIYLAFTIRGDRTAHATARALAGAIERLGHTVLTTHLLAADADASEGALGERAVYERDVRWLREADVLIAEASGSSYGVGFEVGYVLGQAERTHQRVLVLYDASRRTRISRLIAGNTHPACTTYPYRDTAELLRFVEVFLAERAGC